MIARKRFSDAGAVTLFALCLAGCSTGPSIITNSDPNADWNQYSTFGFGVTGTALADTLELYDGTLLEGDFVSSSKGIVVFNCKCLSFSDTPVPNLSAQGEITSIGGIYL